MLKIDQLSVAYGSHQVIKNLSLSLEEAMVHGLVGLNGAGKTTLLNVVAGYTPCAEGNLSFRNSPIDRKLLGYLEAENYFYPRITGNEYLSLFISRAGKHLINDWNELFSLPLDQLVDNYSHGMKKKLALISVLLAERPVMILDEPFNGLDISSVRLLVRIIGRLKEQGRMVIVTSHILESLTGICDKIHLLRDGRIAWTRERGQYQNLEMEIFYDDGKQNGDLLDRLLK